MEKYITITELSSKLGLEKSNKKHSPNHILRYWEKEFKQIKPKIINSADIILPIKLRLSNL